jgi:hypothetical protein
MTALSTQKLYERACEKVAEANFPDYEGTRFLEVYFTLYRQALSEAGLHPLDNDINTELARIIDNLYLDERLDCVPEPSALVGTIDDGRYRDQLLLIIKRASDPTETLATFFDVVVEVAVNFTNHLQKYATVAPPFGSYDAELIDLIPDPHGAILAMYLPLFNEKARELGLFAAQRAQILSNEANVIDQNPKLKKARVPTPALHGAQPKESVRLYLRGTRLSPIFSHKVSFQGPEFEIPRATRFEHSHIVGGSGAGKTTLIQKMVLDDLAYDDPPAMVIIDPKGLLVERIQKLALFDPTNGRLKDRLVIIDPTHDAAPALNMFHPASKSGRMQTASVRRQIENQAISNFGYVFSSVGSKLTDKQSVPFTFLIRLLFTVPDATILTLLALLDDPAEKLPESKFAQYIGKLDAITRGFFENEYYERNFANTRKEIKARLYSVLMRPEFVDMFSAPERKLDMFECLQKKKIVLVNTAMSALGTEGSSLLGRYIITLTLNAAFERIAIPPKEWTAAFLIIDEFQEFADEQKTPELLRLAREYNLGVVLAHQQMHSAEFSDALRNSISTNTSIKYAAAVEGVDLAYVARDLRCDQSFLTAQRRTGTDAQFACFVRNLTDQAISVSVPLGNMQDQPQMTKAAHEKLLRLNAEMLSAPIRTSAPVEPVTSPSAGPAISDPQPGPIAAPPAPDRSQAMPDTPEAGPTW